MGGRPGPPGRRSKMVHLESLSTLLGYDCRPFCLTGTSFPEPFHCRPLNHFGSSVSHETRKSWPLCVEHKQTGWNELQPQRGRSPNLIFFLEISAWFCMHHSFVSQLVGVQQPASTIKVTCAAFKTLVDWTPSPGENYVKHCWKSQTVSGGDPFTSDTPFKNYETVASDGTASKYVSLLEM